MRINAFSANLIIASLFLVSAVPTNAQQKAEQKAEQKSGKKVEKSIEVSKDLQRQYELMRLFVETYEQIDRNYVKDIDEGELMEAAIRGMLQKLDPYSSYINQEQVDGFNQSVDQQFGGIGIQVRISERTGRLTVVTPLPETPAYKAGVLADDTIMEIEGKDTDGFSIQDAVKLLKGKPGVEVSIGVLHAGTSDIEEIKIVREIIQVRTVLGDKYNEDGTWDFMYDDENKIGYLRLTHFSRRSAQELHDAMESLVDQKLAGLVLDLRDNPGGLLSQAVEICDMFIEEGMIVSTKGRNSPERSWEAHKQATYSDFPMAILVNRYSASASEIVSACLQDHKRAIVVGERTWGKGSVQNVINLNRGSSALKLTTASYHRPSGKNIHRFPDAKQEDEWGVKPDDKFELRLNRGEYIAMREYRRDRDRITPGGPPESDFVDWQFRKGLNHVLTELGKEALPDKKDKETKNSDDDSESKKEDSESKSDE